MPTLGFLLERLTDHQAVTEPARTPRLPAPVRCPVCGVEGDDSAWLAKHLRDQHPLASPVVLLDGQPISSETAVRQELDEGRWSVANATAVEMRIDGGRWEEMRSGAFGSALGALRHGVVHVRLHNVRSDGAAVPPATFAITIDIADPEDLVSIESAFQERFREEATVEALDGFAADTSGTKTGLAYADALHGFVRALLHKDRRLAVPGVRWERHPDELNRALFELAAYPDRPLARAASGVARFNLNVFPVPSWSAVPALDRCSALLSALCTGSSMNPPASLDPVDTGSCPVDDVTHSLLQLTDDLADRDRRRAASTELAALASAGTTSPLDRSKANAILLARRDELPAQTAVEVARRLANDDIFGPVAHRVLGL